MKRLLSIVITAAMAATSPLHAQVNLGVNNAGLSIGNSPEWRGVRINFRDQAVREVYGVNITIWQPHQPSSGDYHGIMIGLPSTGGEQLSGMGVGLLGLAASKDMRGVMIGGVGAGAGGDITGLGAGLIGLGAGGDITGVSFAGVGVGAGGDITGIAIGGVGLAAGGDITGIQLAMFGMGAGEDIRGIGIAGFGIGAGGDISGIHLAGFGMGAGGEIRGGNLALFGLGANSIRGVAVASLLQSGEFSGLGIAPAHLRIQNGGSFTGVGLSAYHEVRGHTKGLTIGLLNYTRTLYGVQLGVINVVGENPRGRRMLPVVNWNFKD